MSTRQNHQSPLEVSHPFSAPLEVGLPPISSYDTINMNNPYHLPPTQPPPQLQQPQQLQQLQQPPPPYPQQLQQTQPPQPPQPPQQQHNADALKPFRGVKGDYYYSLVVHQEPIRARMCGFGDKDRRPITPPPCIRLCITDKTGKEIEYDSMDSSFFVLTVDLWDQNGDREVNLVRHAGGTPNPSISNSTMSPYPPPPDQQRPVAYAVPGYLPPAQQGYVQASPQYYQPPPGPHTAYQPVPPVSYQPPPPSGYATHQPMYMGHNQFNPPAPVMVPVQMVQHQPSSTTGMFTRNLIGSLSVNASKLNDDKRELGLWFVLQDLSVRTEGTFRLKMNFVDVGTGQNGSTGLNRGRAPVLATCFSAPFQVYSAKKFPGVIESTPLSKCFAQQGIKIPIRKDQAKALNNQAEYDADD